MLEIIPSNQFKKDLKLAKKRGCKIEDLRNAVDTFGFILKDLVERNTPLHKHRLYNGDFV